MTSNDLPTDTKRKYFNFGFNANQSKAWNPGNKVAEINSVFDVLMTSYDL